MLRRPTAIKLLPPEKAGTENIQRFEREVQLTASLSHPNTVAIFDYGRTPEGVFYYAMEYLDGINLEQLVKLDGPQPAGRVVRILRQVSGALAEAHHIGLVHRDVKPANIILCERGGSPDVAKVVDFGLVKRFRTEDTDVTLASTDRADAAGDAALHGAGNRDRSGAISTPAAISTRSARSPTCSSPALRCFRASRSSKSWRIICTRSQNRYRAAWGAPVPHELEEVILRCLAKQPDDRPSSARALRDRLALLRDIDDWSDDDASRWWLQHRRVAGAVPASA